MSDIADPWREDKTPKLPMPTGYDFRFRRRWFWLRNCQTFSRYLVPKFAGRLSRFLNIGIFEAAQESWLLEHVLTSPASSVIGVDPWLPTTKLDAEFMAECRRNAEHNLSYHPRDKWCLIEGQSQSVLRMLPSVPWFDCAIIDGDHNAEAVREDAALTLPMMKPGGWILFDDVRNRIPKKDHVEDGIKMWLQASGDSVQLVWRHRYVDCYEVL